MLFQTFARTSVAGVRAARDAQTGAMSRACLVTEAGLVPRSGSGYSCTWSSRAVDLGLLACMAWRLFFEAGGHKDAGASAFWATCARHDLACFVDRHRQVGDRPDVLAIAAPTFQRLR